MIEAQLELGAMDGPIAVVGDVHLSEAEPDTRVAFLDALDQLAENTAHLVVLGDLFDAWTGSHLRELPWVQEILTGFKRLADRGITLHFQPGNRDFLFVDESDLPFRMWPDIVRAKWGDHGVLLTHGDLLCTADVGYQRMRRVLRGPLARRVARRLSPKLLAWTGRQLRRASRGKNKRAPRAALGLDYQEARVWLEATGCDVLIAGHVHTGKHHRLPTHGGGADLEVIVLQDWDTYPNAIVWDGVSRPALRRLL